jgi:hypothetical protein
MFDDKEKEVKPRRRAVSRPAGPATEEIPIISIEKATPVKKQSKKVVKKTSKKAAATESSETKSASAPLTAERVKPVAKATTPLFQVAAEPVKISAPVKGKGKAKAAK